MDATWIGVVDVAFGAEEGGAEGGAEGGRENGGDAGNGKRRRRRRLEVKACIKEAASFAVDPAVQERVEVHWRVLEELERAVLCPVPAQTPLSSKGVRKMQTSVGTMLLTAARQALQVDCVFVNGGNIRASVAYPLSQKVFTYKDLKAEIPFPCEMVTVRLPGSVLSSLLQYSRQFALLDPPVEKGGFLQVDEGVRVDASTHAITHVQGRPLEASRMYSLATTWGVVSGIDDLRPILDYREAHPEAVFPTSAEAGRGLKEVLVAHHSRMLWWDLAKHVGFRAMDTDGDGVLSQKEVAAATQACYGEALSRLVVANLMATADFDGDGVISVKEFIRICLSQEAAFQDGDTDNDERLSFEEVWSLLKAHYDGNSNGSHTPIRAAGEGKGLTEADVREMYDEIDSDKRGGISWAEFREHMARQREPTALVI
ncbi:hypothetical protein NGA_0442310 [Nannochloropsis gaditana CCMP526]|uniref:uncharacterized protein n=1 Tax=Nannochloropsis gaditana (strain CCMP526) TaxID=1093141 RepID=UPI00029F60D4|nr:hypothetical protein NGA_0442310 [Nannochloropsis gaditana CCMP526]EKU22334.1 hypothetical protein NGA_0442310 [Nannochloropsis gaditana CCMP526]|eukprot:XP_005854024.1 hypothetical protein NGA_0442310 [Nannochloropsis gaditana CCMP526]